MSKILEEANSIADKIAIFNEDDQNPYNEVKKIILDKKIKLIVTVARGTSDCAALYASYLFAKYLGLPTYSLPPSQITLEKTQSIGPNNPAFLLKKGQLLSLFSSLAPIIYHEEGRLGDTSKGIRNEAILIAQKH